MCGSVYLGALYRQREASLVQNRNQPLLSTGTAVPTVTVGHGDVMYNVLELSLTDPPANNPNSIERFTSGTLGNIKRLNAVA
jgi:hypothetical protein